MASPSSDDNDDAQLLREIDALPAPEAERPATTTFKSPYHLPTSERLRGVANRIMFSRYYIIFYLAMTGLSLGTVILSLLEGMCGPSRAPPALTVSFSRWLSIHDMAYSRNHR